MCQLKQIRSKPNLHFRDFSRWPPFDIRFNTTIGMRIILLYLPRFKSIAYILQLL